MNKRLQNKIAESRMSLPVTSVLVLPLWIAGCSADRSMYVSFVLFVLSSYLMVELNNRNALIRTYSRMVSCSFIVLVTATVFVFGSVAPLVVQLCMAASYTVLFNCYQDKRAQGGMFYAFLLISIAGLFFAQILFLVPVLWLLSAVNLMAFNGRSLCASLIGLLTPYWIWGCYSVFTGDCSAFAAHAASLVSFTPFTEYTLPDMPLLVSFAYVSLVSLTGTVHFLRNSYKDKIRTRMLYEAVIGFNAAIFLFAVLQPHHIEPLLGMMTINAGILAGHFITLTRTRLTNIMFIVFLLSATALAAYNLWIFLQRF